MESSVKVAEEAVHFTDFGEEFMKMSESQDDQSNEQFGVAERQEETPEFGETKVESELVSNADEYEENDSDDDNYTFEMFLDSFCNFYDNNCENAQNPNSDEHLQCDYCDRILNSKSSLHRHRKIHTGEKFQCRFCAKFFNDEGNRRTHEITHNAELHFKCPYCSRLFKSYSSCIRHTNRICKFIPSDRSQIKKAIDCRKQIDMETDTFQLFKCERCDGVFAQQSMFEQHKITHHTKNAVRCKFCTKPLSNRNARSRHQKNCAARFDGANQVIECDEDDPLDNEERNDIMGEMHDQESEFSNQMRSTDGEMIDDEVEIALSDIEPPNPEHSSKFNSKCPYCWRLFTNFSACIRHTKERCAYKPNDPAEVKKAIKFQKVNNEFNFKCPYCSRLYTNYSSCIRHTNRKCKYIPSDPSEIRKAIDCRKEIGMEANETQLLKCEYCDGVFGQQSMLELHQTTHRIESVFRCKFCAKPLSSERARSRHQKICAARSDRANQVVECDELDENDPLDNEDSIIADRIHGPESESNRQMCLSDERYVDQTIDWNFVDKKTDEVIKNETMNDEEEMALSDIEPQNSEHFSIFNSKCPYCEQFFTNFSACIRHTKERCAYKPNDPAEIKRAIKLQSDNSIAAEMTRSDFSDQSSVTRDKVTDQKATTHHNQQFQCCFCDKSFAYSRNCRIHEMIHSKELHFKCPHCSRLFKSHSACITHKNRFCPLRPRNPMQIKQAIDLRKQAANNDTIQSFKCGECNGVFGLQSMLELHEKTHYTKDKKHFDEFLDNQQSNVRDGIERDDQSNESMAGDDGNEITKKPFKCNDCGLTFDSSSQLYRHKRIHTGVTYPCNFCEKVFNDPSNRRNHEIIHNDGMYFKCPYCANLFKNYGSSVRHTRHNCRHIPSDPSQIQKVIKLQLESEPHDSTNQFIRNEKTFKGDQVLQERQESVIDVGGGLEQAHDPLESEMNGGFDIIKYEIDQEYENTNDSADAIERNRDSIIGINNEFNETIKVETSNVFTEVDLMPFFNSDEPKTAHNNSQGSFINEIPAPNVIVNDVSSIFQCFFCNEQFDTSDELKRHKNVHIGETYRCRSCDKQFYDLANWRHHQLTHSNEMNFQCPYCTKLFKSFAASIRHTKHVCKYIPSDSGQIKKAIDLRKSAQVFDRFFKCLYCDSIYGSPSMLVIHQNTCKRNANAKRVFRCKYCSKEFQHASSCCKHQKKCTVQLSEECPVTECVEIDKNDSKSMQVVIDGHESSNQECSEERESMKPMIAAEVVEIEASTVSTIPNEMPFPATDDMEQTLNSVLETKCEDSGTMLELHENEHDSAENVFRCELCSRCFDSHEKLRRHKRVHVGEEYQCRFCERSFKHSWNYRSHELIHKDELNFQCPYCSKLFRTFSSCIRHKKVHCKDRPYDPELIKKAIDLRKVPQSQGQLNKIVFHCEPCNQTFDTRDQLKLHTRKHTIYQCRFECPYCSKLFRSLSGCVRHKKNHCPFRATELSQVKKTIVRRNERKTDESVDEIFWCDYCDTAFGSDLMLAQHAQIHNKNRPFECRFCSKTFTTRSLMKAHEAFHIKGSFECKFCGKEFRNQSSRSRHHKVCANRIPKETEHVAICDDNDRIRNLVSEEAIIEFVKVETTNDATNMNFLIANDEIEESAIDPHPTLTNKPNKSPPTYSTKMKNRIGSGKKSERSESIRQPLLCEYCGRAFASKSTLEIHERSHTGVKPFQCNICHKSFAVKNVLDRHKLIHSADFHYRCKFCSKRFRIQSSYIRHRNQCWKRNSDGESNKTQMNEK